MAATHALIVQLSQQEGSYNNLDILHDFQLASTENISIGADEQVGEQKEVALYHILTINCPTPSQSQAICDIKYNVTLILSGNLECSLLGHLNQAFVFVPFVGLCYYKSNMITIIGVISYFRGCIIGNVIFCDTVIVQLD